jgi:ActR/RegA family two-component response regulator/anti-sigma regulatory factor (Ser/Thr protein kinase)
MWVHSDRRLLNAMIDNLVGNALKYTVRGGILVAFRRSGHGGLVQVWDTGPGIAEEHIEKIFDEFYQVTEGTRDRPKGLGLGLAIVRRTAELLGCQVACRSRPGRGTVFEISLPPGSVRSIDYGEQTPWRMMSTDRPRAVVLAGRRFVVVEDDRLVAEALAAWLSGHQAVVSVFATAEAALASPAADVADCFVVDHQLAGALSGVDFLSAMHARRGGQFRAVLVTGNTDGAQADLVGRGPWPLLFKPTSPTDILAALSAQTLTQEVAAPSDRDVPAGAP